ncbi:MAG: pitrilysin family protein [Cytophagales bacterium]
MLDIDRRFAPPTVSINQFPVKEAQKDETFSNLNVFFVHSEIQPVCRIEWIFDAGMMYHNNPAVPFLTAKLISEGTKNFTALNIQEKIAFEGAFFEVSVTPDKVIFTLHAMNKTLSNLTALLTEVFTLPVFSVQEIEQQKKVSIQQLRINEKKTAFVASREFRKSLFGESHPLAVTYDENSLNAASQNELKTFFEQHYKHCEIIVSGSYDMHVKQFIKQWSVGVELSGLKQLKTVENNHQPHSLLINKDDAVQTSVRFGFTTISRNHSDWNKLRVANEILGGYFGSRLMKNIREDKGWTYGVHSQIQSSVLGSFWVIGTDVKKEHRESCLDEIQFEIQKLIQEGVSDDELESVINYMKGSFVSGLNTPFALADKFKTIHFSGLDYTYYQDFLTVLNTITSFEIQSCVEKYFTEHINVLVG